MLVGWNRTTKRQENLFADTLTIGNIGPYTRAVAVKERRGAVDILVRLGSTLVAKVGSRVSTALVGEDVDETNLNDIYVVVVAEEIEWFLIRPLTLSKLLSAGIMLFHRSPTHPVDCHIRVGRSVECSKRRWKQSSYSGHDGQRCDVQHFAFRLEFL